MHKGAQCDESLLSRKQLEIYAAAGLYAEAGAERELVWKVPHLWVCEKRLARIDLRLQGCL
jgi:hypothetical protein